ncbi:hypothetical protein OROMI_020298 [Orobanche minor]
MVGVQYIKEVLNKENFDPMRYCDDLLMQLPYKNLCHVEYKLEILQDEDLYKSFLQFIQHPFSQLYAFFHSIGLDLKNLIVPTVSDPRVKGFDHFVYVNAHFTGMLPREDLVKKHELLDSRFKQPPVRICSPGNKIKAQWTVQQLCYTAHCGIWLECGVLGYKFKVLSLRFNPPYVLNKIERFLESVEVILRDRSQLLSSFKSELEDMLLDPSLSSWTESEPASVEQVVDTLTLDHLRWVLIGQRRSARTDAAAEEDGKSRTGELPIVSHLWNVIVLNDISDVSGVVLLVSPSGYSMSDAPTVQIWASNIIDKEERSCTGKWDMQSVLTSSYELFGPERSFKDYKVPRHVEFNPVRCRIIWITLRLPRIGSNSVNLERDFNLMSIDENPFAQVSRRASST